MKGFPYFTLGFFCIYSVAALQPYLPLLLRAQGLSPSLTGILLGVFEAAGMGGPFIFGSAADRWGRYKPGLILSHVLILLCLAPLFLLRNPLLIALCMAVMGAGFRSTFPLFDAITTINLGDSGDYGKLRSAGSISYILLMLFFQVPSPLRPETPLRIILWFGGAGLIALISVLIIPGNLTNGGSRPPPGRTQPGRARSGKGFWSPLLIMGLIIIAFSRLAMTSVNSFFSLFMKEALQWDALGIMFALSAGSEVPLMFLSHRLICRFGPLPLLAASSGAIVLRLALYALFPFKGCIILGQLLHSLCYGAFYPAGIAFMSACVPPERRALGMSLYLSIGTGLPTFIGTILGGLIIEHQGYSAMFGVFSLFPLVSLGVHFLLIRLKTDPPN